MSNIELPEGPLSLDSPIYIPLEEIEEKIYQTITQPGSLIRIKGTCKKGKSSLVLRVMKRIEELEYSPIYIDWMQIDQSIGESSEEFFRWLCANLSDKIGLEPNLDQHWNSRVGRKVSCTNYLRNYILVAQDKPIVVIFNHIDYISEWSNIHKDFFSLLRALYEQAKLDPQLAKLRLILMQSTEIRVKLNVTQSPFNVGTSIILPDFTEAQIMTLASRYQLTNFTKTNAQELKFMVGGHPYLTNVALYNLAINPELTAENLFTEITSSLSIYREHLQSFWPKLEFYPECITALQEVLKSPTGAILNDIIAYKLESLGLIQIIGNHCQISCNLYRQYFISQNLEQINLQQEVHKLRSENKHLQILSYGDELTQVANRRYFDHYLEEQWQKLLISQKTICLILLDIDHFKILNDFSGHQFGDDFLRILGQLLKKIIITTDSLVARYGGEEFAVVLPNITVSQALSLGETLRSQVQSLQVAYGDHNYSGIAPYVSISLGVACCLPQSGIKPAQLVEAADRALYQSKNLGRDRLTLSSQFLDTELQPRILSEISWKNDE